MSTSTPPTLPVVDDEQPEWRCLFEKHVEDMVNLRHAQLNTASETAKLTIAQERLSTVLESLNKNLDNGFKLGGQIVSLFARVVLVFLLVVGGLCGVIVYITQIKMEIPGVKLEAHSHRSPVETASPTPSPSPGRARNR